MFLTYTPSRKNENTGSDAIGTGIPIIDLYISFIVLLLLKYLIQLIS
jgi:hypothetical protein